MKEGRVMVKPVGALFNKFEDQLGLSRATKAMDDKSPLFANSSGTRGWVEVGLKELENTLAPFKTSDGGYSTFQVSSYANMMVPHR
jgi:hypothetical protein